MFALQQKIQILSTIILFVLHQAWKQKIKGNDNVAWRKIRVFLLAATTTMQQRLHTKPSFDSSIPKQGILTIAKLLNPSNSLIAFLTTARHAMTTFFL